MAVTPQTNTTLAGIAQALLERHSFVICGHVGPDGDCIGSQLALAAALRAAGKQATCVLAREEPIDHALSFLPGASDLIPAAQYHGEFDGFIAVDTPVPDRLGDAVPLHGQAPFTVTIDHHAVSKAMSDLSYTDPDIASTSQLIWHLITLMGVEPDPIMATCVYTGLVTDTGQFAYQNADIDAFRDAEAMVSAGANPSYIARQVFQNRRLASVLLEGRMIDRIQLVGDGQIAISWISRTDFEECDAVKADAESLVNVLRSLAGVRVVCLLRDQVKDIRGSLRAKDDTDVSKIARLFGGGGHTAAAGFTLHCSIDHAVDLVLDTLEEQVLEEAAS